MLARGRGSQEGEYSEEGEQVTGEPAPGFLFLENARHSGNHMPHSRWLKALNERKLVDDDRHQNQNN